MAFTLKPENSCVCTKPVTGMASAHIQKQRFRRDFRVGAKPHRSHLESGTSLNIARFGASLCQQTCTVLKPLFHWSPLTCTSTVFRDRGIVMWQSLLFSQLIKGNLSNRCEIARLCTHSTSDLSWMRLSHLRNWKVENFFEIRWQTSKKGVKTPVVADICDNYPPHGWRSEDCKPWGVIFLKKLTM